MNPHERITNSSVGSSQVGLRFSKAVSDVRRLFRNLSTAKEPDFERAIAALEALPLASDDFNTARCRVDNVQVAVARKEYGAARYEVRLLANWLVNQAAAYDD